MDPFNALSNMSISHINQLIHASHLSTHFFKINQDKNNTVEIPKTLIYVCKLDMKLPIK